MPAAGERPVADKHTSSSGEESYMLHDILPLLVALNGEIKKGERGDRIAEDKSSHLMGVDICVVGNTWAT